jgi:hypothetical protein
MYKSRFTVLMRRLSMGLVLLVAACGSNDSGNHHEESLEHGSRTQNIDNRDRDASYKSGTQTENTTPPSDDPGMVDRKTQNPDSMSVNDKKEGGSVTGKNQ